MLNLQPVERRDLQVAVAVRVHGQIVVFRIALTLLQLTVAMLLDAWQDLVRLVLHLNVALVAQARIVVAAACHVHLTLGSMSPVLRGPLLGISQGTDTTRVVRVAHLTGSGTLARSLLLRLDQLALLVEEFGASLIVQIGPTQCLL